MNRWLPRVVTVVFVGVLVSPALTDPPADDFPLSTYPMFASDRGAVTSIATAFGHTREGERVTLSPHLLAGTDEPILAVRTANVAARSEAAASAWCHEIAGRAAAPARDDPIIEIEVVVETHHGAATLGDGAEALQRRELARCPVPTR